MKTVLIAVAREDYTYSDTVAGIFPDDEKGLADAWQAANDEARRRGDNARVFRMPFGVAGEWQPVEE